jgi:hypothetical protein
LGVKTTLWVALSPKKLREAMQMLLYLRKIEILGAVIDPVVNVIKLFLLRR